MVWKKIKKAGKKLVKGVKKAFKGIKKVASKVVEKLRSAGREIKRFAKSDLGKVVIGAALIYAGGAAYLAANSGGLTAASFKQALMSPGKVFAQFSSAAGATSGAGEGAALAGADSAAAIASPVNMAGGASGGTVATAAPSTSAAASFGAQAPNMAGASVGNSAVNGGLVGAGSSVGNQATNEVVKNAVKDKVVEDAAGKGFWASVKSNPLTQYGLLQMGGNAIASYGQPTEEEMLEKQYELERQRRQELINGNIVGEISPDAFAGFRYDPVTGQEAPPNPYATGPGMAPQPGQDLQNQYANQGLLRQGAS